MSAAQQPSSDHPPIGGGEAIALFACLSGETRLLVAVSGGPDSVVLLALLADWAQAPGRPALHAATVDHSLRAASRDEAQGVADLCRRLGVPHRILTWQEQRPVAGLQERARAARYGLLADEAQRLGGATLVTAHTQDDQAETVLMRMARGSGPSGLAGMRTIVRKGAVMLARPLLDVPKARLVATAQARNLSFFTDPSNADARFERVRWRSLMPDLAGTGLDAERLALLARRIARLDEAAALRAALVLKAVQMPGGVEPVSRLNFGALLAEPAEIVLRVVGLALTEIGGESAAEPRLERLETCVEALAAAATAGEPMVRTLSGCVLALAADGVLTVRREGVRRRGVHPATS